jgi:group I intron endonuclease
MGYIYKITNKVDGKIYIGQTIQVLEYRWRKHRNVGSNCCYLKRAFNKYGIDNFDFKLICICFDEDLNKYEIQYMEKYNSMVPNGYNLRKGGNSGKHHEETKKKISESLKGRTDIFRPKTNYRLGKHHSEETKKKISDALKGRTDMIKNKINAKNIIIKEKNIVIKEKIIIKINQYDLNNILVNSFNSIIEAANITQISKHSISKVCNNKQKIAGGFIWKKE